MSVRFSNVERDVEHSALRTGCLNVLITDEPTTSLILAAETHPFDRSTTESGAQPPLKKGKGNRPAN